MKLLLPALLFENCDKNTELELKEAERQIESIFISKRFLWIDRIFIIKGNFIIKVYKRK